MGCGASRQNDNRSPRNRPNGEPNSPGRQSVDDGSSRQDDKSLNRNASMSQHTMGQVSSMGSTRDNVSIGSSATSTKPQAQPTHTLTDSKGFRVTSHISSRSKVDLLVRWADNVISSKPCDGEGNPAWRNPQELAREPRKPPEEVVSPNQQAAKSGEPSTSHTPTSQQPTHLQGSGRASDYLATPHSPATAFSEGATGAGTSMQVQGGSQSAANGPVGSPGIASPGAPLLSPQAEKGDKAKDGFALESEEKKENTNGGEVGATTNGQNDEQRSAPPTASTAARPNDSTATPPPPKEKSVSSGQHLEVDVTPHGDGSTAPPSTPGGKDLPEAEPTTNGTTATKA